MASGKKNYFRHSFFARNDNKLKLLRDRVGIGFYFYYFSLLEQCGEASQENLQSNYEFHHSTIRNLWGVNLKKSERIAIEMMSVGLLEFKKLENTFSFTIPNFAKYLGKYESKFTSNSPNKRKEKEIKVNEIKEAEIISLNEVKKPSEPEKNLPEKISQEILGHEEFKLAGIDSPDHLLAYWNENLQIKGFPSAPFFMGSNFTQDFFKINRLLLSNKATWIEYLNRVSSSEFLTRQKKGGPPPITWIVQEKNFEDVMCGKYDRSGCDADDDKLIADVFGSFGA